MWRSTLNRNVVSIRDPRPEKTYTSVISICYQWICQFNIYKKNKNNNTDSLTISYWVFPKSLLIGGMVRHYISSSAFIGLLKQSVVSSLVTSVVHVILPSRHCSLPSWTQSLMQFAPCTMQVYDLRTQYWNINALSLGMSIFNNFHDRSSFKLTIN